MKLKVQLSCFMMKRIECKENLQWNCRTSSTVLRLLRTYISTGWMISRKLEEVNSTEHQWWHRTMACEINSVMKCGAGQTEHFFNWPEQLICVTAAKSYSVCAVFPTVFRPTKETLPKKRKKERRSKLQR